MSQVPDYLEPILAYRVWSIADHIVRVPSGFVPDEMPLPPLQRTQFRLVSHGGVMWTPFQALEAQHVSGAVIPRACAGSPCDEHIPIAKPGCGIYGFKTVEALRDSLWQELRQKGLVGAVWLWGRMVEHEHGYRAQFAYPAWFFYGHGCDARAVAEAYGVTYKEDLSWKSAFHSDDLWQSLYTLQFQRQLLPSQNLIPLRLTFHPQAFSLLFPSPNSPLASQRRLRPESVVKGVTERPETTRDRVIQFLRRWMP